MQNILNFILIMVVTKNGEKERESYVVIDISDFTLFARSR